MSETGDLVGASLGRLQSRSSASERVVLFQGSLAPYRVSMFNRLADAFAGRFTLILTQPDSPGFRYWTVPWDDVTFQYLVLTGYRADVGSRTFGLSFGVGEALDRIDPDAIIVAGWDVHACWVALRWGRSRSVPVHAWVESSEHTGRWRGGPSNAVRRLFLSYCESAIVPGVAAEHFVHSLRPDLPCHHVPNSVDAPELRALDPPPQDGAALFLGELSSRKGADLLLSAAERLLSVFPEVVVAGDGPLRSAFASTACRLPGFAYVGYLEGADRARCMDRASVLLLPSRRDPWPLAACESLISRRPLVVGDGVGSRSDLAALAGDAVVTMRGHTAAGLVEAAERARRQVVPERLRWAFTPEQSASAMAASIDCSPAMGGDSR